MRAWILTIGREILTGRILDTNSRFVARKLYFLGIDLERIVIVDDDLAAISAEVRRAMESDARLIFTLGGLGPTFDDVTLAGVAEATGRSLTPHQEALDFVREKYKGLKARGLVDDEGMTPEREKMAHLPEGSRILPNPVGAAPAVALDVENKTIYSLPGVPAELQAIFEGFVEKELATLTGKRVFIEETLPSGYRDESKLTPILKGVMDELPGIYIKSCPGRFDIKEDIPIVISAIGDDEGETRRRINEAIARIKSRLKRP